MNSRSLLFISNLFPADWAPHRAAFNYQQFTRLADQFDITLLVPVPAREYFKNNTDIVKEKTVEGLRVIYFPFFYIPKYFKCLDGKLLYLSMRLFCRQFIDIGKYEAVVGSWAYPDGYAAKKVAAKLNVPYLIKVHGSDINVFGATSCRSRVIKQVMGSASRIVAVSQALKNKITAMGVSGSRISVIYNGVDKSVFNPVKRSEDSEPANEFGNYILFVGNIISSKGVFELYDAFNQIQALHPDVNLVYVGNGANKSRLQEKVAGDDRVTIIDAMPLDGISLLMANATIVCLPSYREGVPNVLLEAKATGRPVVATRVGGIPEIIDESDGLLVAAEDVSSLSDGLTRALERHWDYTLISKNSDRFSWGKNISEFVRELDAILQEKQ